jgi:uncharacterized protein YraI
MSSSAPRADSVGRRLWLALALLCGAQAAPAADPATALIVRSANVRSGPHQSMPSVTTLLTGTRVTVIGCVASWRWCDIQSGSNRGWVYTRYLSVPFEGSAKTIIDGGPNLGLPLVEFQLGPYWDEHYSRRIWYAEKAQWQRRWDELRPAPQWRPPASRSQ